MKVVQNGAKVSLIVHELDLANAARHYANVHQDYPGAFDREVEGAAIVAAIAQGALAWDQCEPFIRSVCKWGGYAGIGGRVIKNNEPGQVLAAFKDAVAAGQQGKLGEALAALDSLHSLDVAFASKHLRFIFPDTSVILDSMLRENLGFANSNSGYLDFTITCKTIFDAIKATGVQYPLDAKRGWRFCDAETVLFGSFGD